MTVVRPAQANSVFAILPADVTSRLQEQFRFYTWDPATGEVRWMCSWDTTESDIDTFATAVAKEMECSSDRGHDSIRRPDGAERARRDVEPDETRDIVREGVTMALYISLSLLAALAAIPAFTSEDRAQVAVTVFF